jgi:hypothetical protein
LEVALVMNTMIFRQISGFGMPVNGRVRAAVPSALPTMTDAVSAATAGSKATPVVTTVPGTVVCGYRHIADDVLVLKGAFPGTSAWSPPI